MHMLKDMAPAAQVDITGGPLAFPMDKSDDPLRAFVGDYGRMPLKQGIQSTYAQFQALIKAGKLDASALLS